MIRCRGSYPTEDAIIDFLLIHLHQHRRELRTCGSNKQGQLRRLSQTMSYSLNTGGPALAGLASVHSPTENGSARVTLVIVIQLFQGLVTVLVEERNIRMSHILR